MSVVIFGEEIMSTIFSRHRNPRNWRKTPFTWTCYRYS